MDEGGVLGPDFLMVLAAAIGALIGADRARMPAGGRLYLLAIAIGLAVDASDSWRGFLYCLLMPLGAYKVAEVLTAPGWRLWHARRAARAMVQSGSKPVA